MRSWRRRIVAAVIMALVLTGLPAMSASALAPQTSAFQRTWQRTDLDPTVRPYRTWVWGPGGFSSTMWEQYDEAPNDRRLVQYFDKSRMEDNSYRAGDPPWDVSNGLLVKELITGRMQLGDNTFDERSPAVVNVAGDQDDLNGPTYSTFTTLLDVPARDAGATITQRLSRNGTISDDPALAQYGATAAELLDVPGIRHRVASPFWTFMTSSGQVYENGNFVIAPLFENSYYATGYPITEAYWANVKVGNVQQDVLMQCFERRCLTYNPANAPEWQVEMGNVGRHYYIWRHGAEIPTTPPAIEDADYDHLNPAPLVDWPFDLGGQAQVRLQNDSPYPLQVTFDGPTNYVMSIDANPNGVTYPSDDAYPGCDDDGPTGDVSLPPGNYRVKLDFLGGTVKASRGYWTIIPDARYSSCYYVVEQDGQSPTPPTPPDDVVTFGDGTHQIGTDIAAGTYRNSDSSGGCYWERLSGFGGTLSEIIINDFTSARDIVTIAPSDAGFSSDRCGTWTNDLSPITSSLDAPFGEGTFIVSVDIGPGAWRNSDSSLGCYWERLRGFSGEIADVVSNQFTQAQQIVTIAPTDRGFSSTGCGTWTRIGDNSAAQSLSGRIHAVPREARP